MHDHKFQAFEVHLKANWSDTICNHIATLESSVISNINQVENEKADWNLKHLRPMCDC